MRQPRSLRSLARRYFDAAVPDAIIAAERADPVIEPMVQRVMARWLGDELAGPPSNSKLSMDVTAGAPARGSIRRPSLTIRI